MKLNMDELIDPWNFSVTIGGVDYATRPVTLADLSALEQIEAIEKIKAGNIAEVLTPAKAFVESLFDGKEIPPFPGAATEWVPLVLAHLIAYLTERAKKNALALAKTGAVLGTAVSAPPASSSPSAASST